MKTFSVVALMAACALAVELCAADPVDLKVGDPAPKFEALDDSGKAWKSEDHVGKKIVVVYFYPADCTGGCTAQAKAYRDDQSELKAADVEVVGVSGDSVRNHQLFKQKESLNFALLADTEGKVAQAFGVEFTPGEKSVKATINDKEETLIRTLTAKRWTFVIGKDGKIASKNTMVKAADDSKAILELVAKLKK
jgi:peroxiredoxin Q/BCP